MNWANIFHTQLTTSSSIAQSDLDAWTVAFAAAYKTRFAPTVNNSVNFVLAKSVLYTPGGGQLSSAQTMTGTGSAGTGSEINSGCVVLSWLTTVYWRGGKPRTYLPGLFTGVTSNQVDITGGYVTSIGGAAANFRNDINALTSGTITGTTLGFVSFNSGNAPRPAPLFFPFTGVRIHARIGSQRRRLGKWQN